jgi:polyhydroxybutyrate depolymerase
LLTNIKAVKKVFIALSAILVWTAIPAVSANAVSIGQACPKATLGTRVSIRVNKKPVIVVCRNVAGRKKWIRAAVQTLATTTTSTSTTTSTIPEPAVNYSISVDSLDPTLHIIAIEGMQPRSFFLNVPASYQPSQSTPLLLALHSRTTDGREILRTSQFVAWAAERNFIVAALNGAVHEGASSWNAGNCCTNATTYQENDLLFASTVIDFVNSKYAVDQTRVWASGHSNGGMMAYHLACDLSEKITAIAVVTGALVDDTCNPTKPVPLIHLHGDLDPTVPYQGGGKFETPNIYFSALDYSKANTCEESPAENLTSTKQQYIWICKNGSQIQLVNYLENSHEWATGYTEGILNFLSAHPRK